MSSFETRLQRVFEHLNLIFLSISARLRAEQVKNYVFKVLKAWERWMLYAAPELESWSKIFSQPRAPDMNLLEQVQAPFKPKNENRPKKRYSSDESNQRKSIIEINPTPSHALQSVAHYLQGDENQEGENDEVDFRMQDANNQNGWNEHDQFNNSTIHHGDSNAYYDYDYGEYSREDIDGIPI